MNIVGINAYHADASAALLSDGQLLFAIEEERLRRIKHWAGFPVQAVAECLAHMPDSAKIDCVAVSRNPRANLAGKLKHVALHPRSAFHAVSRAQNSIRVMSVAEQLSTLKLGDCPVRFIEHHHAHLASAFFVSPFEEAAVVSIDGFGDFRSMMWGVGAGNRIKVRGSVSFPHSLGQFYSAFTQFLGFHGYGDEYKMMGLAAFGQPRFAPRVRRLIRIFRDQIRLDLSYFIHHTSGTPMVWEDGYPRLGISYSARLAEVFGTPRAPGSEITESHADLAASVQLVLEESYLELLRYIHSATGLDSVCLAGGVALNCAVNGKITEQTPFRKVYVQPAANDAGTSIGAALWVWHQQKNRPRSFVMDRVSYGGEHADADVRRMLKTSGTPFESMTEDRLIAETAAHLADGKIVGWFQGRMEFGPRALGNRSILADPRRPGMVDTLNRRIKLRETFRPFCPSVLAEAAEEIFDGGWMSPFMVSACRIRPEFRDRIPAVTHKDGTGRLQTVERETSPLYWKLLRRFGDLTGVPLLINTSFNENEPVVNTPQEAFDCFMRTDMDVLVIGRNILTKAHIARGKTIDAAEAGKLHA